MTTNFSILELIDCGLMLPLRGAHIRSTRPEPGYRCMVVVNSQLRLSSANQSALSDSRLDQQRSNGEEEEVNTQLSSFHIE